MPGRADSVAEFSGTLVGFDDYVSELHSDAEGLRIAN